MSVILEIQKEPTNHGEQALCLEIWSLCLKTGKSEGFHSVVSGHVNRDVPMPAYMNVWLGGGIKLLYELLWLVATSVSRPSCWMQEVDPEVVDVEGGSGRTEDLYVVAVTGNAAQNISPAVFPEGAIMVPSNHVLPHGFVPYSQDFWPVLSGVRTLALGTQYELLELHSPMHLVSSVHNIAAVERDVGFPGWSNLTSKVPPVSELLILGSEMRIGYHGHTEAPLLRGIKLDVPFSVGVVLSCAPATAAQLSGKLVIGQLPDGIPFQLGCKRVS